MGIEPTWPAWKAEALPLSYTRAALIEPEARINGGGRRIRTFVRSRGQIYSLLPLTTRPPLQKNLWNTNKLARRKSQHKYLELGR